MTVLEDGICLMLRHSEQSQSFPSISEKDEGEEDGHFSVLAVYVPSLYDLYIYFYKL